MHGCLDGSGNTSLQQPACVSPLVVHGVVGWVCIYLLCCPQEGNALFESKCPQHCAVQCIKKAHIPKVCGLSQSVVEAIKWWLQQCAMIDQVAQSA